MRTRLESVQEVRQRQEVPAPGDSELAEWKKRYEAAAAASGHILYDWSASTNSVIWGGEVEGILGYTGDELTGGGAQWSSLIHTDDHVKVRQAVHRAIETRSPLSVDYRIRRKDGTYIHVEDSGCFFYDLSGIAIRFVGFLRDITERKQAENERRRLEDMLSESQRLESVGRLASGVAHEFNNLLMGISGCANIAADRLREEDSTTEILRHISAAAERGKSITRQLRSLANSNDDPPPRISLSAFIEDSETVLRSLLDANHVLQIRSLREAPQVQCHSGDVQQCLINLVLNARDAMPGGGTIVVDVFTREVQQNCKRPHPNLGPGRYAVLTVTDTGCGMDQRTKQLVFEPFFTTKRRGDNSGLGLSTIYAIVSHLGGAIEVDSQIGSGSTFRVYLPAASSHTCPTDEPGDEPAHSFQGCTVLLVEDQELVMASVAYYLEAARCTVLKARNQTEALRCYAEHHGEIDLLLTDVVLPEGSGPELWARLGQCERPRVIFMSAHPFSRSGQFGLPKDACFLHKPFDQEQLREALETVF